MTIHYSSPVPKPISFHSRTESTCDDWQTPTRITANLGEFDLDPCANTQDPTRLAQVGYAIADDGLRRNWQGRVWLNPPYGKDCKDWIGRLADHGNGIALIVPRTGSKWFHQHVWKRANAMLFLESRIAFIDANTGKPVSGNNADSVLVAYGARNVEALRTCGLKGQFIELTEWVQQ